MNDIKNIRWSMKGERGVILFDYQGVSITITEPKDVILDDNDPSRKWIWERYCFLLALKG